MNGGLQPRWMVFFVAVPISLYVSFFGTLAIGLCSGPSVIPCWPHTVEWILVAPCLLLAKLPLRAAAIVAALLLVVHSYVEVHFYGENIAALWDTDIALDKCFCAVVILLVVSALFPRKIPTRSTPAYRGTAAG
jgi:hypothetical protein